MARCEAAAVQPAPAAVAHAPCGQGACGAAGAPQPACCAAGQAEPAPTQPACGLERYRVRSAPPHDLGDLYLMPDYVSPLEEARLMRQITSQRAAWVQLSGRRLQNHGGSVHAKGSLVPAPMPQWLAPLCARATSDVPPLAAAGGANHVLINSYMPGEGIMPHSDGPLYAPVVCILSLGSPCVIRFWRKAEEGGTGGAPPAASLALPRRSLLVFCGAAYEGCLHGIEEAKEEALDGSVVNRRDFLPAGGAAVGDGGRGGTSGSGGASFGNGCGCGDGASGCVDAAGCSGGVGSCGALGIRSTDSGSTSSGGAAADGGGRCAGEGGGGGGAPPTLRRTGERLSLTIRRVLKVHKGLRLPGAAVLR